MCLFFFFDMVLDDNVAILEVLGGAIEEGFVRSIHRNRDVLNGLSLASGVCNAHTLLTIESVTSAQIALGPTDDYLFGVNLRRYRSEDAHRMALVIVNIGMNALDVVVHKCVRRVHA